MTFSPDQIITSDQVLAEALAEAHLLPAPWSPHGPDELRRDPHDHVGSSATFTRLWTDLVSRPLETEACDLFVLIDGLGSDLWQRYRAEAPTLRRLESALTHVRTVFPATTATALASLTTGLSPAEHGIVGYRGLCVGGSQRREAINQLTGHPDISPETWPLVARTSQAQRRLIQIAPTKHVGSHLSRALYSDMASVEYRSRHDRVDTVARVLARRENNGAAVYLHLDDVDHAGHRDGPGSESWRHALAEVDGTVAAVMRRAPRGTRIHLTADHGMVHSPQSSCVDLADHPDLAGLVEVLAGDPRAPIFALAGRDEEEKARSAQRVAAVLAEITGGKTIPVAPATAVSSGLLGPADLSGQSSQRRGELLSRLGEMVVVCSGNVTVVDSRRWPAHHQREQGVHASLTPEESIVPYVCVQV